MRRWLGWVAGGALIGLLLDACGREDVVIGHHDAGLAEAAAACTRDGAPCQSAQDCCSLRCEANVCLPGGACLPPQSACMHRAECCSGRCEPSPATGALRCTAYCSADGVGCQSAQDCCSLACNAGTCGGPICHVSGNSCQSNAECCSGQCVQQQCELLTGACRPDAEECSDSDAGTVCCSSTCINGKCDLGPGACREPNTPCSVDADCCRGQCLDNADGTAVCTAPCLAVGASCNSDGDCCSSNCTGEPLQCE